MGVVEHPPEPPPSLSQTPLQQEKQPAKDGLQNHHQLDNVNNNLNLDQQTLLENSLNNNHQICYNNEDVVIPPHQPQGFNHNNNNTSFDPAVDYYNHCLDVENNNELSSHHLFVNPYFYPETSLDSACYTDELRTTTTSTATLDPHSQANMVSLSNNNEATLDSKTTDSVHEYQMPMDNCAVVFSSNNDQNNSDGGDSSELARKRPVFKDRNSSKLQIFKSKFVRNRRKKLKQFSNKISENANNHKYFNREFFDPATSQLVKPEPKPAVVKVAKMATAGGGGGIRGAAGRGSNDALTRRPRRRIADKTKDTVDPMQQLIVQSK